jgi:aryl-alcohol dehydrogenase-like predicted oxidoreductase
MVIATKVAKMDRRRGLSAANIIAACEDSLNRLQTDYIDLYYSHEDDPTVSLEETLGAYAQLIAQGKVRYIAASNFTAARLRESITYSHDNSIPAYIAVQDSPLRACVNQLPTAMTTVFLHTSRFKIYTTW